MTKSLLLLALLIIGHLPPWSRGRFNTNDEYDRITIFKIALMSVILVLLAGCAARQPAAMPWAEPAGQPTQPVLPETVREPLSPRITDPAIRARLAEVDAAAHPDPQRLEILILQALAKVPDDAAATLILDRLWGQEPLVGRIAEAAADLGNGPGMIRVAALVHHLLLTAPVASWQNESARKVFDHYLARITPGSLSGYPLHFHCQALLRGGRFAEAVAALRALEPMVPADIQVTNLTLALETALAGQAVEPVSTPFQGHDLIPALEILADLCRIGAATGVRLPEELMVRTAQALQGRGHDLALRRSLGPWLSAGPGLSLSRLRAMVFTDRPSLQTAVLPLPRPVTVPTPASTARPARHSVHVQIEHIRAGRGSRGNAANISESVRHTLNHASYTLVSSQTLVLVSGQSGEHAFGQGRLVRITALDALGPKARFDVRIMEHGRQVLHTVVQAPDGGETYIGGPRDGTEQDLIRLKVRIGGVSGSETGVRDRKPVMACLDWAKMILQYRMV